MSPQVVLLSTLLVCLLSPCAWPQGGTTTVSGTVRDQAGAVMPNTAVTLTAVNTNEGSTIKTSGSGSYIFPSRTPSGCRVLTDPGSGN